MRGCFGLFVSGFALLVFCFWAEIIPMPGSAARNAANARHSPKMTFSGRIMEHKSGGLVVFCDQLISQPPEGFGGQDLLGEFFLVGHTAAEALPDDQTIRFDAYRSGLHTYLITLGKTRTVRRLLYAPPEPTPRPKRGDWMRQ